MWSRNELKSRAKGVLNLNYWKVVLVSLISIFVGVNRSTVSFRYSINTRSEDLSSFSYVYPSLSELKYFLAAMYVVFVMVAIMWIFALVLSTFIFQPLAVGCYRYFILCGKQPANIGEVVFAFNKSYINVVKIMFFRGLYTFLWSLLFIIPGIIKAYEYRMIPYLLAENPDISMKEAFSLTRQMMTGDKANTWVLDLSFIGWDLLGVLTCGILNIFYVNPYRHLTNAQLYKTLKQKIAVPSNHRNEYDPQRNPYL